MASHDEAKKKKVIQQQDSLFRIKKIRFSTDIRTLRNLKKKIKKEKKRVVPKQQRRWKEEWIRKSRRRRAHRESCNIPQWEATDDDLALLVTPPPSPVRRFSESQFQNLKLFSLIIENFEKCHFELGTIHGEVEMQLLTAQMNKKTKRGVFEIH